MVRRTVQSKIEWRVLVRGPKDVGLFKAEPFLFFSTCFFPLGLFLRLGYNFFFFFFWPNLHNENVMLLSLGQKKAALSKTSC